VKRIVTAVDEWAKGLRPTLMVTVEPDRDGRTAAATWATKFLVWVFPALVAADWISNLAVGYAVAATVCLVLSRVIYVGPAVAAEPEPADLAG
jgi:hypothetical protein